MKALKMLTLAAVAMLSVTSISLGQVWQFDPNSLVNGKTQAVADDGAVSPYANLTAIDVWAMCPVMPVPPPPPGALLDDNSAATYTSNRTLLVCTGLTKVFDYGSGSFAAVSDPTPPIPPFFAQANGASVVGIQGIGTRSLEISWRSSTFTKAKDDPYFARVCTELASTVQAFIVGVPPGADLAVSFEWKMDALASEFDECPADTRCGGNPAEDLVYSQGSLSVDVNGNGPGAQFNVSAANTTVSQLGNGSVNLPGAPDSIPVTLSLTSRASAILQTPGVICPPGDCDEASAEFCCTLILTIHSRHFTTLYGGSMADYMRCVVGNSGPNYAFSMGKFEITNAQFSDFLNVAQLDGGATDIGRYMVFGPVGEVLLPDGNEMYVPHTVETSTHIDYNPTKLTGVRYSAIPGYDNQPVENVTWLGALKFCNWLTLDQGFGAPSRCYTEGTNADDWHPVTITTASWISRDLSGGERKTLVENYRGFRLPMDSLPNSIGWVSNQVNPFNEWYKAAAYDPVAPNFVRLGPGLESVPARYWTYGFGRDMIDGQDANFMTSGDPWDDSASTVGFFNGLNLLANGVTPTRSNNNHFGIFDLSGNVWEHIQCRGFGSPSQRGIRGGNFAATSEDAASSVRSYIPFNSRFYNVGFRVMRVAANNSCCCGVLGDANGDGTVDISDAVFVIAYIFGGGPAPDYVCLGDADANGGIDISDAVFLIAYIFGGGPMPICP